MQYNDIADAADRSSYRSSEDGTGSSPAGDELSRVVRKIEHYREKLKEINLERESDVESFLSMSRQAESHKGADNPQLARIRQTFEKKNKRHAHDTEGVQKKLAECEGKLMQLKQGNVNGGGGTAGQLDITQAHKGPGVISSVGYGLWKTGANLKGRAENVMAAPMELAAKLRNTLGSSDDVTADMGEHGNSTFYATSDAELEREGSESLPPHNKSKAATLPPGSKFFINQDLDRANVSTLNETSYHSAANMSDLNVFELGELTAIKAQMGGIEERLDKLNKHVESELLYFSKALEEERFRSSKLEALLNETIDLHQSEFQALKQEQQREANRLEYQYNERFRLVEDSVGAMQNEMQRVENRLRDALETNALNEHKWGQAALSGVNILVELLKMLLLILGTALDMLRPLAGSRNKAGFLLLGIIAVALLINNLPSILSVLFSSNSNSTVTK